MASCILIHYDKQIKTMSTDPLSKLVVSESQDINRQELSDLLLPYVTINKEAQGLDFTKSFRELPNLKKILVLLAAFKARNLVLGIEEKVSPSEVMKMDIMPEGSVKTALKSLLEDGEIKSDKGKYYLPNYKIPRLVATIKNQEK